MISERSITITGEPSLEAAIALPAGATRGVVVCHPHPRYGGDMESPVVTTAAGACARRGLATIRFNFRGVGGSQGTWDGGQGEQADVRAALGELSRQLPGTARVALAGYSFGASMATAVAASGQRLAGLALIAPPLAAPGWQAPAALDIDGPLLIVAGSDDAYCPREALTRLATALPRATITVIDGTDHFFFAGLDALASALADWAVKVSA